MFQNILVVCVGNICRSPFAQAKLAKLAPSLNVHSAGVRALEGRPADPMAQQHAARYGLDLTKHRATQLNDQLCRAQDLILVMEPGHVDAVCSISPGSRGKVMLLGRWEQNQGVPDPYRKEASAFTHALELTATFCRQWTTRMNWH